MSRPNDPPLTRDEVLSVLSGAIEEARWKVESGRVYDAENERVRQGWIKTLSYAVNTYASVLEDRELDELAERLDELEKLRAKGSGRP
jgi:hypothetical protein